MTFATTIRRSAASLVMIILMVVALLALATGPAAAHSSSYCGHGNTGYWDGYGNYVEVNYGYYSNGTGYYHKHHRYHYLNGDFWHSDSIQCPYYH